MATMFISLIAVYVGVLAGSVYFSQAAEPWLAWPVCLASVAAAVAIIRIFLVATNPNEWIRSRLDDMAKDETDFANGDAR
jgi:Na+/H+-translocating membrane pyrophosphatase